MTNTLQQSFEQESPISEVVRSSNRMLFMLGTLGIILCALYITSVRVVESNEYALRSAANARDNAMKQYGDLGRQLDSLRSLAVISQAPALAGFQEVQKPLYLNMDAAQSVAVAH